MLSIEIDARIMRENSNDLEGYEENAEEQLASLRKAEVNAKPNFNQMLKQGLEKDLKSDSAVHEEQMKDLTKSIATKCELQREATDVHEKEATN